MKKGHNILTYYYDKDEKPVRLRDKISYILWKKHTFKVCDSWAIVRNLDDGNKEICGAFYYISGPKILVDLLGRLSNFRLFKKGCGFVEFMIGENEKIKSAKESESG